MDLYAQLSYHTKEAFQEAMNPLNDLRNSIAHPARSLITNNQSLEKLWGSIDRIEELLFALR